MKQPAVYILASGRTGTLYTGVTSNLAERTIEHKSHALPGFTSRYKVDRLVWFEPHPTMESAISREKGDQTLAAEMEAGADRERQPALGRSV